MKVLDLQCAHQHTFEGWFGSEQEFAEQMDRGLLVCPLCGDGQIRKMPSAPRLNLQTARDSRGAPQDQEAATSPKEAAPQPGVPQTLQARWIQAMRHLMANTEDVGERFAQEARAMHQGETDARAIRGQASREETLALLEEGIDVLPLPALPWLKETLQ